MKSASAQGDLADTALEMVAEPEHCACAGAITTALAKASATALLIALRCQPDKPGSVVLIIVDPLA
ncbi:MAG TPA: hypothetical protein PL117_08925 [Accumulibacter sp.]|uniref:hypothetical protein n=1 Tax=Accumulibacter sp. TaxID=2053492 RepID=UPI002B78D73D|nr:hypothetical protein [Accumulibacter sp.]HRF72881.1 hypothetical protein [Accumulibacter sp.]